MNSIADQGYTIRLFDGVGRVFGAAKFHPGSTGGYSAQNTIHDVMGRAKQQSNPTEIAGNWVPAGDDAAGWIYSQQTYDWQGRPLVTTNQDGTQKYASYGGCGCAGGEIATLTDEVGRQQKVYSDVLGRQWKSEVLNWNGTVYSTTTNTFNARDQVTLVRQWAGAENGGGTYQDATMSYDGYGRLKTKHVPEQNTGTATVYSYNSDDTIQSVTDARGASATYGYNSRHLITSINYSAPSGIPATSNVIFGYDAAGNRTLMNDGLGSQSYGYNQLSQMSSETRTFTGFGSFTLGYDYNLAGQLKSLTDPFNATINYGHDAAGRLSSVTGTSFGGVTTYASNPQYRAWGGLKSLSYGNTKTLSMGYNNRLLPTSYEVSGVLKRSYQRNNDGGISFTQDQLITNSKFDRLYTYDHVGRVATALTGAEARGGGPTNDRPYNETLTYDAFNHLTTLARLHWDRDDGSGPHTFVNNRIQGYTYDADGRVLIATGYYNYDAAGRVMAFGDGNPYSTEQVFTGDGRRAKTISTRYDEELDDFVTEKITYYITSSVLGGQLVTELSEQGAKERTTVFAGGSKLASQTITSGNQSVQWQHYDASGASYRETAATGQWNVGKELDPLDVNAGLFKPFTWNVPDKQGLPVPYPEIGDMLENPGGGCTLDFMPISCEVRDNLMAAGSLGAVLIAESGRRTNLTVRNFGVGLYTFGLWIEDEGGKLENRPTQAGDEFDEGDVLTGNTDEDGLGHWEYVSVSFMSPQRRRRGGQPRRQPQQPLGGKPSGSAEVNSLGVDEAWSPLRCQHLRELLNREALYGTAAAARMSMSVRGGKALAGLSNGPGTVTVHDRPIDQDWLVTLKAFVHDRGFEAAAAVYVAGKRANQLGNRFPGGKRVSPPWQERGERIAVELAGGPSTFNSIFDEEYMKKVCPGY